MSWAAPFVAAATLLAYLPALGAGYIWDDDKYVTQNPTLTSTSGLWEIWANGFATPQYYPLVHTSYWIEHRLWGFAPFGYHLDIVFATDPVGTDEGGQRLAGLLQVRGNCRRAA